MMQSLEKLGGMLRERAVTESHYRVMLWLLGLYWFVDSLGSFHHGAKYLDPAGIQLSHTGLLDWVGDVTPAAATVLFLSQAMLALVFAITQKRNALLAFVLLDAFLYLVDIDRGQNHRYLQVLLGCYILLLWPLGRQSPLSRIVGIQLGWVFAAAAVAKMNPTFLRGDVLLQMGWLTHSPFSLCPDHAALIAGVLAWGTVVIQLLLAQLMVIPQWQRFRGFALLFFHGLLIVSRPPAQIVFFNMMMIAVGALWWPTTWVQRIEQLRERVQSHVCSVTRPRWAPFMWAIWAIMVFLAARRLQSWTGEPSLPWLAAVVAVLVPTAVTTQRGLQIKPWATALAFCLCAGWVVTPHAEEALRYPLIRRAVLNLGEDPTVWERSSPGLGSPAIQRVFAVRRFIGSLGSPDALSALSTAWSKTAPQARAGDTLWRSVDLQLAQGLIDQKHHHRARDVLQQLLAYEPLWWEAHHELGIAHWELGAMDEAETAYRRAVSLGSYPESSVSQYIRLLMERSKEGEARSVLAKAREFRPDFARSWDVLAKHWGL